MGLRKELAAVKEPHPWVDGRKVLVPVPVGEEKRRARLRKKSGFDDFAPATSGGESSEEPLSPTSSNGSMQGLRLLEENERLRAELVKAASNGDKLEDLRYTHNLVVAERDSLQLDLAKQEDELFILRQTNEEHAQVVGDLRKATEVAEAEADQNEQHLACMQLMEEQERLELAYEETVAQLGEYKRLHHGDAFSEFGLTTAAYAPSDEDEADDSLADQSWDHVELGDLVSAPVHARVATKKPFSRVLTKRARTRSQPLLYSPASPQEDVAAVKNDVEQLKQTIALLVRERHPSSEYGVRREPPA
ncbi:hypothetical protein JCM10449v2_000663 [Rhodotorula kratochvilovae]